jgi:branched-chain amino acid transport system substrate-binding protein
MSRSSVLLFLGVFLLAACRPTPAPFACADRLGCVEIAPDEPVKLGVLQALSGDQAPFGLAGLHSIELAVDDRDGRLLGHPIDLQIEDSLCSKEGGATAAARLVSDPQIVGILGPSCSGAAETAIKTVSDAGWVLVSGSSTAPSLTSVGGKVGPYWHPGFLRTAQNDEPSGRAAASFAYEVLGVRRAATIDDGDPYTQGLADTFRQAFTEMGGEAVLSAAVNKGDTNMQPVLDAVAKSGAELLFLPVFQPEGDRLVIQARETEALRNLTLMTAEGLYVSEFVEAVGPAGVGMYMVVPAPPLGPARDQFASRYLAKFGEEPANPYCVHNYDAANLLFRAIESVAVQDEADGTLHIGRQALRDALYTTSGFQGLTGTLSCDSYGDCGVARFQVIRLDDPSAGLAALAANVLYTYPPEP